MQTLGKRGVARDDFDSARAMPTARGQRIATYITALMPGVISRQERAASAAQKLPEMELVVVVGGADSLPDRGGHQSIGDGG
jgi:outer membrane receptor for ferric coprogen and ferric-rhodotorulic acid